MYEVSFFIVLHSLSEPDDQNSDYIELCANFNGSNETQALTKVYLKTFNNQNKWIKNSVAFELKSEHVKETVVSFTG